MKKDDIFTQSYLKMIKEDVTTLTGTPAPVGNEAELSEDAKAIIEKNKLVFNEATQSWDAPGDVKITKEDMVGAGGKFPIKFGVVEGSFRADGLFEELTSLENSPRIVKGTFSVSNNDFVDLTGSPDEVGGDFWIMLCHELTSFKGCTQKIGGSIHATCCHKLVSLEGIPRVVRGGLWLDQCDSLRSLKGAPDKIFGIGTAWGQPGAGDIPGSVPIEERRRYNHFIKKNSTETGRKRKNTWAEFYGY